MNRINRLISVILLISTSGLAYCQLSYLGKNPSLSITCANNEISYSRLNGFYWHPSDDMYFKIDLTHPSARISGSGECVNFYDARTNDYVSIIAKDVFQNSDARAKSNIADIDSVSINSLTPVSFKWKNAAADALHSSAEASDSNVHYGFIAQEVEKLYPYLVRTDARGVKMVNYAGLLPLIIKNLQETDKAIKEQEDTIESLFRELELLQQ